LDIIDKGLKVYSVSKTHKLLYSIKANKIKIIELLFGGKLRRL